MKQNGKKSIWSREHPKVPDKGSKSEFHWFYKDGEDQLVVSELWAERCWFSPGWWGPRVIPPKESIPK